MQDIRALALDASAAIHGEPSDSVARVIHTAIHIYAVDLLMNLAAAIAPTSPAETDTVAWLRQEVAKVAKQIPAP